MTATGAGADAEAVEEVARTVLASRKYRSLDERLVRRFARESLAAHPRPADAAKHAKRKLHQAFGAFLSGSPTRAVDRCVDAVLRGDDDLRSACRTAMRSHASTSERTDHLDDLYASVAAWCGPVRSVLDLACGLNPLAIPWMELTPGARYACCDIDRTLMAALGRLNEIVSVEVRATTCDLVAGPGAGTHPGAGTGPGGADALLDRSDPTADDLPASGSPATAPPGHRTADGADLVLLLKTATTLEQQRPGATSEVLRALAPAPVVLSLPTRSLAAGRRYGRDGSADVDRLVAGTPYRPAAEAMFGGEIVCHLVADHPRTDSDTAGTGRPGG